jgi:hypothetical protein
MLATLPESVPLVQVIGLVDILVIPFPVGGGKNMTGFGNNVSSSLIVVT